MHILRTAAALVLSFSLGLTLSPLTGCESGAPPADAEPTPTEAAPTAGAAGDMEARKARILANLKVEFPQLEELNLVMEDIKPSKLPGFDEGGFTINGQRSQRYLISKDDKTLFLVSAGPIDASRSTEDIQKVLAQRAKEKAEEAAAAQRELDESIAGLPVRGNPSAKVTIVEFSDFQCPYCARGAQTMEQVLASHPDDVKFVFKHYPLNFHPWAKPAAIASYCAGKQKGDAFWTLHDAYFKNQGELRPDNVVAKSKEYLTASGIDMGAFSTCAEDTTSEPYKTAAAAVDADMALGEKLGVNGTPAFFVNGRLLSGAQPPAAFAPLIAEAKGS